MENTKINDYILRNYNTTKCKNQIQGLHCNSSNYKSNVVDNESLLLGIKNPLDRNSFIKDQTTHNNKIHDNQVDYYKNDVENINIGETTRVGRSVNTLSGVQIDRFEFPFIDPQMKSSTNNRNIAMNTRLYTKDNINN